MSDCQRLLLCKVPLIADSPTADNLCVRLHQHSSIILFKAPQEAGIIVYYLFVSYSVTCLNTFLINACFTSLWTSISVFYHNTARDVVTVLLIFAKYLSLYLHIFTCTHRGTHTQAHMYNQHTRGMATTRHRSLVGRSGGRGFVRDRPKKKEKKRKKNFSTPIPQI